MGVNDLTIKMTVEEVRGYLDGDTLPDDFDTVLDEAQGRIHSGQAESVIIKIELIKE